MHKSNLNLLEASDWMTPSLRLCQSKIIKFEKWNNSRNRCLCTSLKIIFLCCYISFLKSWQKKTCHQLEKNDVWKLNETLLIGVCCPFFKQMSDLPLISQLLLLTVIWCIFGKLLEIHKCRFSKQKKNGQQKFLRNIFSISF